ncbi:hypothetical protein MUA31_09160 [Staphylococcus simulans]|uniref:hypothetical protein n=1 Tax=Staphylococcus simulans TaxID=1286 RepID=UPI0021D06D0D|nr:hypothetical protein [Staphylococcus simulans]UXR34548.1 hypothetical protein MUA31_09160 [Staphylococcus simulans]
MREEPMRMQYTITFEKDVPVRLKKHEDLADLEEEVIERIFRNAKEHIDGEIKQIDNIEWRY